MKGKDEQLTESFYRLSSSVFRQIATESRMALCKFSETILMDMLSLNDSEEKYRLLLIFLQIHHPKGISRCDNGAYAYDWNKWKDFLRSMCLLVQKNCKSDAQWRSFIQFASEGINLQSGRMYHTAMYYYLFPYNNMKCSVSEEELYY